MLSALADVGYVAHKAGLARGGRGGRRADVVACSVELAGVLVVGTLSLVDTAAFPDDTVWSGYGRGYGFIPLVLPVLGLLWLRHQAEEADQNSLPPKSPPPPKPPPSTPPPLNPPPS